MLYSLNVSLMSHYKFLSLLPLNRGRFNRSFFCHVKIYISRYIYLPWWMNICYNFLEMDLTPENAWSFGVYIKRRETSGRMKYDKTASTSHAHSFSFSFECFPSLLVFCNGDKWSAGAISTRNRIGGAAAVSYRQWTGCRDVYRERTHGLCTPYWNVHHARQKSSKK